jgi:hypothetical protein
LASNWTFSVFFAFEIAIVFAPLDRDQGSEIGDQQNFTPLKLRLLLPYPGTLTVPCSKSL